MMVSYRTVFTCFRLYILFFLLIIFVLGYQLLYQDEEELEVWPPDIEYINYESRRNASELKNIPHPVIIWWTPFSGEQGAIKRCGNVKCFFTINRDYKHHSNLKAFMFYGTDYNPGDLPLPRQPHHEWALLHEESPKNNYLFSHNETMILFNHTSTFRRHSDYPLTTQYLPYLANLTSMKYTVPLIEKNRLIREEGLALIAYVQSDCGTASDRDQLVRMLQRYIAVDSYGQCLHNKDLPEHLRDPIKGMNHDDFHHHLAKYKFVFALENAICEDYITEKFWRPFIIGSVPIVYGSPKARDYIPANNTAIFVDDFNTIEELAEFILRVNRSDALYNEYLGYKKRGIQNDLLKKEMESHEWFVDDYEKLNFIDGFECFVCKRMHENMERESNSLQPIKRQADFNHYGCPRPQRFSDYPRGSLAKVDNTWWIDLYKEAEYRSQAALKLIQEGKEFHEKELNNKVIQLQYY